MYIYICNYIRTGTHSDVHNVERTLQRPTPSKGPTCDPVKTSRQRAWRFSEIFPALCCLHVLSGPDTPENQKF